MYPSLLFVYILLEEIDDKITLPNIDSSVEVLQQVYDTRARIDNKWMVVNGPWLFYRGLCYLELASKLVGNFLREIITIVRSDCWIGVILFCLIILILCGAMGSKLVFSLLCKLRSDIFFLIL